MKSVCVAIDEILVDGDAIVVVALFEFVVDEYELFFGEDDECVVVY